MTPTKLERNPPLRNALWSLLLISLCAISGCTREPALPKIMQLENIGVQRTWLEQITGPAREVDSLHRTYRVDDCQVDVNEDAHEKILNITLTGLSRHCSFDAASIGLRGPAHLIRSRDLMELGEWDADETCIGLCGNASDPSYSFHVRGPRAALHMEYSGNISYEAAGAAASQFGEAVTAAAAPEFQDELHFQYIGTALSLPVYNGIWKTTFGNHLLSDISFGYDLGPALDPTIDFD